MTVAQPEIDARPPAASAELEATAGQASLLGRFRDVRARSLALAGPLSVEDQVVQSMPDASPTKWHLAHTTWFFETMVLAETANYVVFDPAFGFLFNSYYEALGPRQPRARRGLLTRPSLDEVRAYRAHVDRALETRLERGVLDHRLLSRVVLGLAHEEQHQELIVTDALHMLAQNPLRPAYDRAAPLPIERTRRAGVHRRFEGGLVEIGTTPGDGLERPFAFDNEGPTHRTYLRPFRLAERLVANAEWLEFIEDGGYRRAELWLSDGWAAVAEQDWSAPLYWEQDGGDWRRFGPAGLAPLPPNDPVQHVSFYEADAFARWSGRRLPSEAEWEFAAVAEPASFEDLLGAVWQWTASAYTPYPGFRPGEGALGEYNGKFMINQMVLRGSSWATALEHSRPSYRNFFQPHQRWQVTGVRLAEDAGDLDLSA